MCSTSLDTREVSYDEATVNNNNKVKQQLDTTRKGSKMWEYYYGDKHKWAI